jgi:hypothetical protein
MAESAETTLLALLLALKQLETPLTADEQADLDNVGKQLYLDPDDWEDIKEGLIAIIEKNPSLDRLYQAAKVQLEAIDGNIPSELLPTEQEREAELLADEKRKPVTFGNLKGDPDPKKTEVKGIAASIFAKPDSTKDAKERPFLERIQAFLQKPKS